MNAIEYAKNLLKTGKLVAIPTETVYGLGADARNTVAVQNIYLAKERPLNNPLIIHLPHADALADWAINIPDVAFKLAHTFWPGPLTLILRRHPSVPKIVTGGQESIALRIPNHPLTLELLKRFDGGIAAPSANRYGRISPTTAEHVRNALGSHVDYILDGGPCTVGIESTIVSLLEETPKILREGSITKTDLSKTLNISIDSLSFNNKNKIQDIIVPGSHTSHYAPVTSLHLCESSQLLETIEDFYAKNQKICVLSFSNQPQNYQGVWVKAPDNPSEYAQKLYAYLHDFDATHSHGILIEMPPKSEAWKAILDRLQRASTR